MTATAMPEFLTGRRDIAQSMPWVVEQGQAARGGAWTAIDEHRMRVPFGSDDFARIVRAHEMMHARISPMSKDACSAFDGIDARAMEMAEEFRVNTMLRRAGFDVDALYDGSETMMGQRIAERKDWTEAIYMLAAVAGTKAGKDYLRGIRKVNPEWAKALREVEKTLVAKAKKIPTNRLSSTKDVDGIPAGFVHNTTEFAKIIRQAADAGTPNVLDANGDPIDGVSEEIDADKIKEAMKAAAGKSGMFAPLILDTSVALTRRVSGNLGRKRIATNMGRHPRRIGRLLTDPHRRIFDRTIHGQGGIVVIDQSGSMSLGEKDLWQILEAAPGCVVVGYSHRPGTTEPNTWVLAERGRVCDTVRRGRSGNGVDGPALRFALSKRRKNEPVIWVCDGHVTDGKGDETFDHLNEECAALVVKHGIHMVRDTEAAVEALQAASRGERLEAKIVGPLRHTRAWADR